MNNVGTSIARPFLLNRKNRVFMEHDVLRYGNKNKNNCSGQQCCPFFAYGNKGNFSKNFVKLLTHFKKYRKISFACRFAMKQNVATSLYSKDGGNFCGVCLG